MLNIEGNIFKYSHQSSEVVLELTEELQKESEECTAEIVYSALTKLYGIDNSKSTLYKTQGYQIFGKKIPVLFTHRWICFSSFETTADTLQFSRLVLLYLYLIDGAGRSGTTKRTNPNLLSCLKNIRILMESNIIHGMITTLSPPCPILTMELRCYSLLLLFVSLLLFLYWAGFAQGSRVVPNNYNSIHTNYSEL